MMEAWESGLLTQCDSEPVSVPRRSWKLPTLHTALHTFARLGGRWHHDPTDLAVARKLHQQRKVPRAHRFLECRTLLHKGLQKTGQVLLARHRVLHTCGRVEVLRPACTHLFIRRVR